MQHAAHGHIGTIKFHTVGTYCNPKGRNANGNGGKPFGHSLFLSLIRTVIQVSIVKHLFTMLLGLSSAHRVEQLVLHAIHHVWSLDECKYTPLHCGHVPYRKECAHRRPNV